ncbi:type II secretion system protein GspL [Ramlibacter sp.]|uniref:type II secretion system protein GspL n=1 Tax=Ramlibacter sp. TaxID=1917967 RepID=UPI003D0B54E2
MSTLVVLLPASVPDPSAELEFATSADGRTVLAHATASAALLPQPRGAGAEVVAIVPAQALSWHRIELPRGLAPGSPRLRSALEGLLEEKLLDEPDAVHFAVEPRPKPGEPVWVAACDRAWLRAALQVLEQAGRPVSRVVPEFAPQGIAALHAVGHPDDARWVSTSEGGVLVLPLAAATLALVAPLSDGVPCIAEPAVAALAEQVLQEKVELQQPAQRWVAAAAGEWDLAQFEFASSGRTRAIKKLSTGWAGLLRDPRWRPARWGAALLVAVNLLGLNAWAWKERSSLEAKREVVRRSLTATFPHVKVVVDPKVQMEREVTALRLATGAVSARDVEVQLAALAVALPGDRRPSAVNYSAGELRVLGLGLRPDEIGPLVAGLKSQGFAAAVQNDVLTVAPEDVR